VSGTWKPTAPAEQSLRRPAAAGRRSLARRVARAWRVLTPERRLAAVAAGGLFISLFLNWYQETVIAGARGSAALRSASVSLTGWQAFSFVEAAVLLVAVGVLALLFLRAEGRAFHVPGGDGGVITAAGLWTCLLIVWRIFDKEGTTGHVQYATASGVDWGIFVALGLAGLLTYAGSRVRRAADPEPPLPGDDGAWAQPRPRARPRARPRPDPRPAAPRPAAGPAGAAEPAWPAGAAEPAWPARTAPAAAQPTAPTAIQPTAPAAVQRAADEPPEHPAGAPRRRARPLDSSEIERLDIAEPPPPRLRRARPAPYPSLDELHARRGERGPRDGPPERRADPDP